MPLIFDDASAVSRKVALAELKSVRELIEKWEAELSKEDSEAGHEYMDDELQAVFRQFGGELLLASGKLQSLVQSMAE